MSELYSLSLTLKQREVVSIACLMYDSILRGNLTLALSSLPFSKDYDWEEALKIIDGLSSMLPEVLTNDSDGFSTFLPVDHNTSYSLAERFSDLSPELPPFVLTLEEAQVLSKACDVYARTLMGQVNESIDNLPFKKGVDYEKVWKIKDYLKEVMPSVMIHGINGWSSSLGVGSPDLHENSNIAVDIHQVIRHKLSWERAVENGTIESEKSSRKWPEMIQVCYDDPFHWGSEPLCSFTSLSLEGSEK